MSVAYCDFCHAYIDLDWNDEHFDEDGECLNKIEAEEMDDEL